MGSRFPVRGSLGSKEITGSVADGIVRPVELGRRTVLVVAETEKVALSIMLLVADEEVALELSVLVTADDAAGAATENLRKRRAETQEVNLIILGAGRQSRQV